MIPSDLLRYAGYHHGIMIMIHNHCTIKMIKQELHSEAKQLATTKNRAQQAHQLIHDAEENQTSVMSCVPTKQQHAQFW